MTDGHRSHFYVLVPSCYLEVSIFSALRKFLRLVEEWKAHE